VNRDNAELLDALLDAWAQEQAGRRWTVWQGLAAALVAGLAFYGGIGLLLVVAYWLAGVWP
jgi:hypothetical protein